MTPVRYSANKGEENWILQAGACQGRVLIRADFNARCACVGDVNRARSDEQTAGTEEVQGGGGCENFWADNLVGKVEKIED